MPRHFRFIASTAAVALIALVAFVAPASAGMPGTFSVGGNFGTGIYSNSDLNDAPMMTGLEKVTSGWEYGGSLRYQVSPRLGLDLEANFMKPKSTTVAAGFEDTKVTTSGVAIPLNLYYRMSENETTVFNLFGGAGIVTSAKAREQQGTFESETDGKSSFYGQAGLEAQYMVSPMFAFGARALGRMAKSELERTNPSDPAVDIDYSGFAFSLGARMSFGGGGE